MALAVGLATAVPAAAHAARPVPFCFGTRFQCASPQSMSVLPRPGQSDVVVDSNFGLVFATEPGKWRYTCDDVFTGRKPFHARVSAEGRIYVPADYGLYASDDGCAWTKAEIELDFVEDIALDPSAPGRLWVLGGEPRALALSTDGGLTLAVKQTLPAGLNLFRVTVAPSNPKVIYLAGYRSGTDPVPLVLVVSTDGGETVTVDENLATSVGINRRAAVDLIGVAPDDPATVYFSLTDFAGDQIWKSTNHGRGLEKVLTMSDGEARAVGGGFAFGADGNTLYVASYAPIEAPPKPPGSLYVSHDAGKSWERRPSPSTGPRYQCLAQRGGVLYACGSDFFRGDAFLIGSSKDEGRTWSPVMRFVDVLGPRSCVADRCQMTSNWFEGFRSRVDAGPPWVGRDAVADGPTMAGDKASCACRLGSRPPAHGRGAAAAAAAAAMAAAATTVARVRRRRRRELIGGRAPAPDRAVGK